LTGEHRDVRSKASSNANIISYECGTVFWTEWNIPCEGVGSTGNPGITPGEVRPLDPFHGEKKREKIYFFLISRFRDSSF